MVITVIDKMTRAPESWRCAGTNNNYAWYRSKPLGGPALLCDHLVRQGCRLQECYFFPDFAPSHNIGMKHICGYAAESRFLKSCGA